MRNSFIHSFIALLFVAGLCSCQMEGPISDITIHNPENPRNELRKFETNVTDGVVKDGALSVIPKLGVEVEGSFIGDLCLSYNVDDGESVVKEPVDVGRRTLYDLDGKVWSPGTHRISGKLLCRSLPAEVLATFDDSFTITEDKEPIVEDDYLVSIVRGVDVTPLHTTETVSIPTGADFVLKIDFKGKGSGKVTIKNIDYTLSLMDFNFAEKFEGEGMATVPFKTLKTGQAEFTVTFAREDKTYKPNYKIDVIF